MAQDDFSGIWRSTYRYTSSSRNGEFENQHLVRMHHNGNQLVIESVPESKSYLILRLSLDGKIATGSWQEETEKDGYYKGTIYHGAIQLTISNDKHKLSGKWVGFGKDMELNVGPWEFVYVGEKEPEE
jgi:hypothetical protein